MMERENEVQGFWEALELLISESELVIDRPRGSTHPHYPVLVYPLDYGYLKGTISMDGGGIDVWSGTLTTRKLDTVLLTVDLFKHDAEINLLIGCSDQEKRTVLDFSNNQSMRATLIRRDGGLAWLQSRRSVRHFLPKPVPDDLLYQILETAAWAPSAHNSQPWRFVVLKSPGSRRKLIDAMGAEYRKDLRSDGLPDEEAEQRLNRSRERITSAPAAILLCLDPSRGDSYPDPVRQNAEYLAAHAVGLAGFWMCAPLFSPSAIRHSLDLPGDWHPVALILLGYPDGWPEPRPRLPLNEVVRLV
jgi:inorganic pyrophosphatase